MSSLRRWSGLWEKTMTEKAPFVSLRRSAKDTPMSGRAPKRKEG